MKKAGPEGQEGDKMKQVELLALYLSLKHGDKVAMDFSGCWSGGKTTLIVTSAHRVVGKRKVGRIIFKHPDNLRGCKFVWYNDDGRVSMAHGDMAATLKSAELVQN
ncbi:MAG: hypothetical protein CXT65_05000 [Methanobacteriota archaeon]|nr:MAG: hypothetical protein CXT65_05000 [Euryarchaeota archaeon]